MKKLSLIIFTTVAIAFTANAAILFYDDYTVTGGGDVNFEYATRQTGTAAPQPYQWANGPCTVTNAGPNAGKLHMDGAPVTSWNAINHNFVESPDFSIEYELTRQPDQTNGWDSISFGKDAVWKTPNGPEYGMGIIFFENGWYQVFDSGTLVGSALYPEHVFTSNATIKIKVVVSQQDFTGGSDAQVALFINDKPCYLQNVGGNGFTYTFANGFTNNFITLLSLSAEANIDNLKIATPENSVTSGALTGDGDCGVTNAKVYTHCINMNDTANIVVNGQTFTGAGIGTLNGTGWDVRTANGSGTMNPFSGANPEVTPAIGNVLSNFVFGVANAPGLILSGLTPSQQYLLTLYNMSFGGIGDRPILYATSDGAQIVNIDENEFGGAKGQLVTYQYTANDDGVFSISMTPTNATAGYHFYAFSNEEIIPEPATFALISLLGMLLLRKK